MQQTIVIIDDNFSIRQILKVFLSRISKRFDKNINVFSTNNGVEGLGYIYITSPTIIIIDTTLPKYSGREVLDYLINNPKFQSTDVKVIVLQEQSQIIPLIPESFSIVNKDSDDAFQKVSDILLSCLQVSPISNSFGLINKLAEFVFINGNKNDLLNRSLDKKNIFLRIFLRIKWVWLELSTSLALTIMMLIFGRADDENISQAEIEKRTYRTKYYPSLVITTVSLTIILVNLGLFAFTQYTLYKNRLEGTRALNTMVVNSVLDDSDADPGDGVCDVKGSSGTGPCTLRAAIEEANAETDDVEIVFDIEDQIATINTSTSENATTGQTQQKTFYDSSNGAHWSFYYNGTEIEYSYSSDLVNWTTSNTLAYNTSSFSLFYKDISETPYLFLVTECNTYDVCLRRGTLSATSISFESEIIVFDGIDTELNYTKPIVSLSANNHVWVASRENKINVALDQFNNAIVRRSTNIATGTLSTWEEPSSLEIPSDSSGDLALISQVENDMVLISGNSSNHISAWKYNGSTWTETGDDYDFFNFAGFGTTGTIDTLLVNSGYVYIGGNFADVENIDGTSGGSYVTRLNISTSQFEGLGNATAKGVNGFVDDLAISGDYLYLGGSFTLAYASPSDITVNRIARIDISSIGNSFETLGNGETKGVNDWVYTLSISGDYLYLGGGFTTAYASPSNITVNHIARIDISSSGNSFEALGNDTTKGVNGAVFALTTSGDYLYLGGGFPTAYANPSNITVNHIARIDITTSGNSFEALGNASTKGVNNTVNTLAVSEDYLYLGGVFTSAFASPSNITVNRIARVDISSSGNSFEALGNHTTKGFTSGAVNALAVSGSYLYIGGTFTIANATPSNITVNRTARIDTTSSGNSFEALGNGTTKGVNNTVFALSFSGDQLYIGGNFTSAGDYSTNRLTVYKPSVTSNTQSDSKNSSISDLSGNIYLSYTKSLNNDLYLKRMDYTDSAWGEEILIYEGDVTDQNIYFDQENDKLTVFFIDNTELYYIQGNIPYEQADWDSTAKLLDTSLVNNLSVGQSTLWDYPYVVYTKGVETPYNIKFAEIGNPNIKTIFPELSLPVITNDKIKIDASTQQSSVCETNSLKIELDGLYAGLSSDGISLATGLSIDADVLIK